MKDVVYMKVSKDQLELPEFIADSIAELSNLTGYAYGTIASEISRHSKIFVKVKLDQELYPDNDGGFWYKDPDTWETVYVEG